MEVEVGEKLSERAEKLPERSRPRALFVDSGIERISEKLSSSKFSLSSSENDLVKEFEAEGGPDIECRPCMSDLSVDEPYGCLGDVKVCERDFIDERGDASSDWRRGS